MTMVDAMVAALKVQESTIVFQKLTKIKLGDMLAEFETIRSLELCRLLET